jgi:hypothetical protein
MKKRIKVSWLGDEQDKDRIMEEINPGCKVFKVWDFTFHTKKYIVEKEFENGDRDSE